MMLQGVSGFSSLREYVKQPENRSGCFADTSILFAATYPFDIFADDAAAAFDVLAEFGVPMYSNVTVRAEYLENHRRLILAECLVDLLEDMGSDLPGPLHEKLKAHRTSFRRKMQEEKSAKLELGQIKIFRALLDEYHSQKGTGWSVFCRDYLHDKLEPILKLVEEDLRVNFISLRSDSSSEIMTSQLDWHSVVNLMGHHGILSSDAMIINMFLSSNIPAILTADYEMALCVSRESKGVKRVFIPNSAITKVDGSP